MNDFSAFTKMVPGFEFLQGLAQNTNAAMPGIGQWIAPTLDPAEIEKRIGELRTVQFWLEQNVRMVDATVRALEVQRMTLSTLKTMNVRMDDLRTALTIPTPTPVAAPAPTSAPASEAAGAGMVDPLQWWGALTKQFTELATNAMKDTAAEAARQMASAAVARPDVAGAAPTPAASKTAPATKTGGRGQG